MPPILDPMAGMRKTEAPCRTCTDFKTWARQQREVMDVKQEKNIEIAEDCNKSSASTSADKYGCPYDKNELGNATWGFLHTMAARYPDVPTKTQQSEMSSFFDILSKYYPCEYCAKDLQKELKQMPVEATSQQALSQWLCRLHNKVNIKIGKSEFDCSLVDQRWLRGWKDGSCDT